MRQPYEADAAASRTLSPSVADGETLAVVRGRLDLVDERDGEVFAGDERHALVVADDDVAALAVAAGALPRIEGAERLRGVHEEPVERVRRRLEALEDVDARLRLGLVLLGEVQVDQARAAGLRERAACAAHDAQPRPRAGELARELEDGVDRDFGHVAARCDGDDRRVGALQLGDEARCVDDRPLDVGRTRDALGRDAARDRDDVVSAAHPLGHDVRAGVAGPPDDGDACHGLPFVGVSRCKARPRRFIPSNGDCYAWSPPAARMVDTWYRATDVAIPALSDSVAAEMGIDTIWSHVSVTRRERPLPSEPTTMRTGRSASWSSGSCTSPPPSRPSTKTPCFLNSFSVDVRFGAIATGMRAAAPALVFHAAELTLADRRCGITMPWPPKAAVDRMIAPRLRGSVTPSRATRSGVWPVSTICSRRSCGWAYSYGGTLSATPWCTPSKPAIRSSSGRVTSRTGI